MRHGYPRVSSEDLKGQDSGKTVVCPTALIAITTSTYEQGSDHSSERSPKIQTQDLRDFKLVFTKLRLSDQMRSHVSNWIQPESWI